MLEKFKEDGTLCSNTDQQKPKYICKVLSHVSIFAFIKEILHRKMVSDIMVHPVSY